MTTDPQNTIGEKILQIEQQLSQEILRLARDLPHQREERINTRIKEGQEFNTEIKDDVDRAKKMIEEIKVKLQNMVWNREQDEGYLTHEIAQYLNCFKGIDADKLDQLLAKDLQHWRDNLQAAIEEEKEKIKSFEKFFNQVKEGTNSILKRCQMLRSDGGKYFKLTRLPRLPDAYPSDKINFQWPTDDMMKEMLKDQEISMKQLDIWMHDSWYLCSVQATLTNGEKSPLFRAEAVQHQNQKSLNINTEVRKLSISCNAIYVYCGIRFLDRNDNKISEWDDGHNGWREQKIPEGEKLIGIYGYMHPGHQYIYNFGFITVAYK